MSFEVVISALVALGVGGALGYYIQYILQHKKDIESDIHKLKRTRYGSILIQMLTILDPKHLPKTQEFRSDFKSINDVKEELKNEMLHAIVFAADDVIKTMSEFVQNPDKITFFNTVLAMRKDLCGKKIKINEKILSGLLIEDFLKDMKDSA